MIIQLDPMIQQAKTIDDLKPILRLLNSALNTMDDAKKQTRGDGVYHDGGIILRGSDNNYHRVTLTMNTTTGVQEIAIDRVGLNPTGE